MMHLSIRGGLLFKASPALTFHGDKGFGVMRLRRPYLPMKAYGARSRFAISISNRPNRMGSSPTCFRIQSVAIVDLSLGKRTWKKTWIKYREWNPGSIQCKSWRVLTETICLLLAFMDKIEAQKEKCIFFHDFLCGNSLHPQAHSAGYWQGQD